MCRLFVAASLLLVCWTVSAADMPQPAGGVARSALFTFNAGDRIEDTGRLLVSGGRFNRTEDFEVVRHPDGGRTLTTIVTAAENRYQVEARVALGAAENALSATGIGSYEGQPVTVNIQSSDGKADLRLAGAVEKAHSALCGADCLIDMSPSALPMFTMTRRYDESAGGAQTFRWVGRSLTMDQVLLDGTAELSKLGDFVFRHGGSETAVKQYAFVETLKDEVSGNSFKVGFNLYTTADHRPLAFATGGTTVGERVGYEGITVALPVQIPAVR
jgi:hypothetical protein